MIPNDISAKLNIPTGRVQARPASASHAAEEAGEAASLSLAGEDVVTLSKGAVGGARGAGATALADERAAWLEAQGLRQAITAQPLWARGALGGLSGAAPQLTALLNE